LDRSGSISAEIVTKVNPRDGVILQDTSQSTASSPPANFVKEKGSVDAKSVNVAELQSSVVPTTEQTKVAESSLPETTEAHPRTENGNAPINTTNLATEETTSVAPATATPEVTSMKTKPRQIVKRRRRRKTAQENKPPVVDPILLDKVLRDSCLPSAYTFEVLKTVERIIELQASHVALQMPEGLLMYATVLADIFRRLAPCCTQVSVLGDVTYGGRW
jgi:hypothetical protein